MHWGHGRQTCACVGRTESSHAWPINVLCSLFNKFTLIYLLGQLVFSLLWLVLMALYPLVGMLHASVAPPRPHSIAVLSVVIAAITVVVAQTHSRAMIAWGAGVLVSHVSGYLLSAHCFEQQAAITVQTNYHGADLA